MRELIHDPGFVHDHLIQTADYRRCTSALLVAFENGTQVPPILGSTGDCNSIATEALGPVLSNITSTVELFTLGTASQSKDFNGFSPFVLFSVYKAAAIVTKRLLVNTSSSSKDSIEDLRKLRLLRNFLGIVRARWLGCREFTKKGQPVN